MRSSMRRVVMSAVIIPLIVAIGAAPIPECVLPMPSLPCAEMCAHAHWLHVSPNEWPYCEAGGATHVPMAIWDRAASRPVDGSLHFAPCGRVYGESDNLACESFPIVDRGVSSQNSQPRNAVTAPWNA